MKKTAILPSCGDPLLLRMWLKHYEQIWADEVDELIVSINSAADPEIAEFMQETVRKTPKTYLQYVDHQTDHGIAINDALEVASDGLVMLIEEDAFVRTPGQIAGCFRVLEDGEADIVGSPRDSCGPEVAQIIADAFGKMYSPKDGGVGVNFWPNFFFTSTERLKGTDRNFCARGWNPGDEVLPGFPVKELNYGDTFVNTSIQLRQKNPRITIVPQYHGHPEDMEQRQLQKGLWDGYCPWFHMGSLSSGVTGVLTTNDGRPLTVRHKAPQEPGWELPKYANTEMERMEWERRIAWWTMALESADKDSADPIPLFRHEYREALDRVTYQFGLSPTRIIKSIVGYKELITWKI